MTDWVEATLRLVTDPLASSDAVFFHARAEADDDGLFELVANLHHGGWAKTVVVNGSKSGTLEPGGTVHSYPGVEYYEKRLRLLGISSIYETDPAFNTLEENQVFLKLAREKRWKRAILVSQPHQILRIFLGAVQTMKIQGYWMTLYASVPSVTDWLKPVYGSQGQKLLPRHQHISEEEEKVIQYQGRGDIATLDDLLHYLNEQRPGL